MRTITHGDTAANKPLLYEMMMELIHPPPDDVDMMDEKMLPSFHHSTLDNRTIASALTAQRVDGSHSQHFMVDRKYHVIIRRKGNAVSPLCFGFKTCRFFSFFFILAVT
jgi:hypothetical protein